jgi:hypothetical protein
VLMDRSRPAPAHSRKKDSVGPLTGTAKRSARHVVRLPACGDGCFVPPDGDCGPPIAVPITYHVGH